MTSPLHSLEGLSVTNVVQLHGYIQLRFGDEIGMSIYNDVSVTPSAIRIDGLVGKMVISITEQEDCINIRFLDGSQLRIEMRQEAYKGPEAIELHRKGFPPVIWN